MLFFYTIHYHHKEIKLRVYKCTSHYVYILCREIISVLYMCVIKKMIMIKILALIIIIPTTDFSQNVCKNNLSLSIHIFSFMSVICAQT